MATSTFADDTPGGNPTDYRQLYGDELGGVVNKTFDNINCDGKHLPSERAREFYVLARTVTLHIRLIGWLSTRRFSIAQISKRVDELKITLQKLEGFLGSERSAVNESASAAKRVRLMEYGIAGRTALDLCLNAGRKYLSEIESHRQRDAETGEELWDCLVFARQEWHENALANIDQEVLWLVEHYGQIPRRTRQRNQKTKKRNEKRKKRPPNPETKTRNEKIVKLAKQGIGVDEIFDRVPEASSVANIRRILSDNGVRTLEVRKILETSDDDSC